MVTRYITVYTYPKDMPAKDKVIANATITQEPYEVSDEEVEAELKRQAREEALQEITDKKLVEIKSKLR